MVAELRQPSTGAALSAHDQVIERLCADGTLVAGLPQDPRAYRPSPLRRAPIADKDAVYEALDSETVRPSRG